MTWFDELAAEAAKLRHAKERVDRLGRDVDEAHAEFQDRKKLHEQAIAEHKALQLKVLQIAQAEPQSAEDAKWTRPEEQ